MATYGGSSGTVSAESLQQWRDRKRYLWLVALVMPMLPFAAVAMNARTGQSWWLWLGPIVILGLVPLIDVLGGLDRSNPPDDAHRGAGERPLLPLDHVPVPAAAVRRLRSSVSRT